MLDALPGDPQEPRNCLDYMSREHQYKHSAFPALSQRDMILPIQKLALTHFRNRCVIGPRRGGPSPGWGWGKRTHLKSNRTVFFFTFLERCPVGGGGG